MICINKDLEEEQERLRLLNIYIRREEAYDETYKTSYKFLKNVRKLRDEFPKDSYEWDRLEDIASNIADLWE